MRKSRLKILKWIIVIIIAIPVIIFGATYGASELSGEVITLDRKLENGDVSPVRLWIVDQGDVAWIEHGDPSSFWMTSLETDPSLTITRNGETAIYHGSLDPEAHELYRKLRREKYTWGDQVVEVFAGDNADRSSIPVRLVKP